MSCNYPVMTIGREVIAEVNIDDFSFNLLIDEDSLWTGRVSGEINNFFFSCDLHLE